MDSEHSSILTGFPNARYHPVCNLITWHPQGVLDDDLLDQIASFMGRREHVVTEPPFHRYTDLSALTDIRLKFEHVFEIAQQRRASVAGLPRVKSAIYSDKIVGFGMARMYETLMDGASVEVRAFRDHQAAAQWLGVPPETLLVD